MVLSKGTAADLTVRVERGARTIDLKVHTRAARDGALPGVKLPDDAIEWAGLVLAPPTPERMGRLGVTPPPDERMRGVLVLAVAPASPGSAAGLSPGDILLEVSGSHVEDPDQLLQLMQGKRGAAVTFWRSGGQATAVIGGLERREP